MSVEPTIEPMLLSADGPRLGVEDVGVKGWYLERLVSGGFSIPAGCIVPTAVYRDAIRHGHVDHRLRLIWDAAAHARASEIPALSRKARHLISTIELGASLRESIARCLEWIHLETMPDGDVDDLRIAVRSSATLSAVSGPECSGVHTTYLDVSGVSETLARIHSCWASLYGEAALSMRSRGLGSDEPTMAVVLQAMVDARASGIVTPTGSRGEVLVEATFGLGEPIITGAVEPDRYVVDRFSHDARSVTIGKKQITLGSGPETTGHRFTADERRSTRVLDDAELRTLSTLSSAVDRHFGGVHELEWSIDATGVRVLQVRPVTPGHHVDSPTTAQFVTGLGVGNGWATGRVRVIDRYDDLGELRDHEILVATETTPQWLPHIQRAAAVITDLGDATSHAARTALEHGIPAVVGTDSATETLEDGSYVTVDASRGWVIPTVTFAEAV